MNTHCGKHDKIVPEGQTCPGCDSEVTPNNETIEHAITGEPGAAPQLASKELMGPDDMIGAIRGTLAPSGFHTHPSIGNLAYHLRDMFRRTKKKLQG